MIRAITEPLVFFTIPFALYVLWLIARLINPFRVDQWTRRVLIPLAGCGLALAVGSLVLLGLTAPRYEGGYVPAHIENGRVVSGHMQ